MTRIEDVLDIYDQNRLWYNIPSYNGYQLSNDNIVRSMKHYKKYPYGILLSPSKQVNGINYFQLTNSQNKRVTVSLTELKELVAGDEYSKAYPSKTTDLYQASRNQKCTIYNKPVSQDTFVPKFHIV